VFQIGVSVLDTLGDGSIPFGLPNDPTLAFRGFHLQGVIGSFVTGVFQLKATNDLSITIRP
jgi:hypothetical protein